MKTPQRRHTRITTEIGCRISRRAAQARYRDALITEAETRRIWPSR